MAPHIIELRQCFVSGFNGRFIKMMESPRYQFSKWNYKIINKVNIIYYRNTYLISEMGNLRPDGLMQHDEKFDALARSLADIPRFSGGWTLRGIERCCRGIWTDWCRGLRGGR